MSKKIELKSHYTPKYKIGDTVFYWDFESGGYESKCRFCDGKGKLMLDKSEKRESIECPKCFGEGLCWHDRRKYYKKERKIVGIHIHVIKDLVSIFYTTNGDSRIHETKIFSNKKDAESVSHRKR